MCDKNKDNQKNPNKKEQQTTEEEKKKSTSPWTEMEKPEKPGKPCRRRGWLSDIG